MTSVPEWPTSLAARARSTVRLKAVLVGAVIGSGRSARETARAHGVSWWLVQAAISGLAVLLPARGWARLEGRRRRNRGASGARRRLHRPPRWKDGLCLNRYLTEGCERGLLGLWSSRHALQVCHARRPATAVASHTIIPEAV